MQLRAGRWHLPGGPGKSPDMVTHAPRFPIVSRAFVQSTPSLSMAGGRRHASFAQAMVTLMKASNRLPLRP